MLLVLIAAAVVSQNSLPATLKAPATFVASTPCSKGTKPLPGIPANAGCELMKWNLSLYRDAATNTPAVFKLHCLYGLPKQGTRGFIGGGEKLELEGRWIIVKGMKGDPNAIVYRLTDNKTGKSFSFVKLNDSLLHLLDSDQRLMIGTAAWSYTLSRIGH